ncbi:MAG TPA: cytochrome b [Rhodanobacteraceae bacterium]
MASPEPFRYKPIQRHLHWIIFALVAAAYLLINLHHHTARGTFIHGFTEHLHMVVGVFVLLLVLPRLWMRGKYGAPPIEPPMAMAARWFARVTHCALYAFLVVQPILGIAYRQLEGKSISLLGVTLLPSFVSHPNKELARELFFQYHSLLGTIFYWVIGLHILAALWHHFMRRDDTMKRMLGSSREAA